RLTATPEIREANFSTLPGQLSKGASAWIASVGFNRATSSDRFFSGLADLKGGASYRLGVTEDLTLGAGVVYDRALLGYSELFFQPTKIPLQIAFSGLMGANGGLKYNANVLYRPSQKWEFRLDADDLSQRFQVDWRLLSGISFKVAGNTRENALSAGLTLSQRFGSLFTFADVSVDTNNRVRWTLSSYLARWQFINQGSEIFTNSDLIYNFTSLSDGHSLRVGYETRNSQDSLASLGWRYRSPARTFDGRTLWELELGYGFGSRGSGLIASAATNVLPGVVMRLRYESISVLSDSSSFRLEVSPSFNLTPRLTPSDPNIERLRNEGGIYVQPFLDGNNNGQLDGNETAYAEDMQTLLRVNDQSIRNFTPHLTSTGLFLRLPPGRYRVDLDPAGYPIDWKPAEFAYGVEVSAGGYTSLPIPFTRSYSVTGVALDRSGQPMGGAKVEAVPTGTGKKVLSVTNGAGVFFLEGLAQGSYNLLIDNQPTQPDILRINAKSESLQEVTLQQGR
ncbi:carboxypeptidase regulatory-like domain-containing protein, partial [Leptolyngbya sp. FACHB-36]|uniref:carboxypeptidase-like regulatory domain-containing protein n=1 Tax=Leptolyngbya sp. FACHB-36 TaxID=2692808 RepID=UPI00167FE9A0